MGVADLTVWLVRHGATAYTEAGRFNGRTDISLSKTGRDQARALRGRLALGPDALIWSSPSLRAVETARLAAGEPIRDDRLQEIDFGALEGMTWEECSPEIRERLLSFEDFSAPGGEAVAELRRRVHGFLTDLPPGPHCLFTHGGVIRLLLRKRHLDRRVGPGEVVVLPLATGTSGGHNSLKL